MAATVITSTSASQVQFGATAETGIILSTFTRTTQSQKTEVANEVGDIVALSYYGANASLSISGVLNGNSGVATAGVASILTLANSTISGGVTGGKIVVDSVSFETGNDTFKTITIDATQYPSMG
jgi:hypothetical protein